MENSLSERVILKNVVPLNKEIGRGSYGRVFTVKYCGLVCAAKEIHSILLDVPDDDKDSVIRSFLRECYHCSELRHPNIVQFMGVYYDDKDDEQNLPIMVMELMDQSLTSLVEKQKHIEMKVKMSILHDVSLGLSYLHGQDEPIVHRDLSPNNVLLTAHMIAKISDLGIARVLKPHTGTRRTQYRKLTQAPGTLDFMAPETFYDNPTYNTSIDVFSFAGIALHLMCEEWPTPSQLTQMDSKTGKVVAFTEVERRQKYFDKMSRTKISTVLQPLLKCCLDNDPLKRPLITTVSEKIEDMKVNVTDVNSTVKEKPVVAPKPHRTISLSSAIPVSRSSTLPHHSSSSSFVSPSTTFHQCAENQSHSKSQYQHADFTTSLPHNFKAESYVGHPVSKRRPVSPHSHVETPSKNDSTCSSPPKVVPKKNIQQLVNQFEATQVKIMQVPKAKPKPQKVPLISALESGKHYIKWRRCANLMCPMYAASVATDKECVYVMGDCAEKQALNVVFTYRIATESWTKLPPSDHRWGVLQMVGDKLAIFGGIDDYTEKRTNRVSTFDKSTKSWSCFYPDMIGIRFRPGVATHLDNVIVAGGNKDPKVVRDDIEVLNWRQRVQWVKSSVSLPVPMWALSPIISNDELFIVGYIGGESNRAHREAYKIPVISITSSLEQKHQGTNKWVDLPPSSYYYSTLIPNSSPPVFVGGEDKQGVQSSNVSMYDSYSKSWRYVDSLSSPRSGVAVATIDDYSIIVIGGYTKGHSTTAAKLSSLPIVEIGQAELA